jgi:hypothetical protein
MRLNGYTCLPLDHAVVWLEERGEYVSSMLLIVCHESWVLIMNHVVLKRETLSRIALFLFFSIFGNQLPSGFERNQILVSIVMGRPFDPQEIIRVKWYFLHQFSSHPFVADAKRLGLRLWKKEFGYGSEESQDEESQDEDQEIQDKGNQWPGLFDFEGEETEGEEKDEEEEVEGLVQGDEDGRPTGDNAIVVDSDNEEPATAAIDDYPLESPRGE